MRRQLIDTQRSDRTIVATSVIALLIVVAIPSAATSGLPFGGALPAIVAVFVQILGLLRSTGSLSWPPGAVWLIIFLVLQSFRPGDMFYTLIIPLAFFQYILVWSASPSAKIRIRNWVIGIASAEAALAIVQALAGWGPLLGAARTIDTFNPFLPSLLRSQGTFSHPLVLALTALVGLALALPARDLRAGNRIIAVVILTAGAFFTGSSTAVIVIGVLIGGFLAFRSGLAAALCSGLLLLIIVLTLITTASLPENLLSDTNERSRAHRLNAIAAIPALFDERLLREVFFGSSSIESLYARGVLINDGFYAVDNQIVTSIALGGLIGAIAAVVWSVIVFVGARDWPMRIALFAFFLTALSFDFLLSYTGAILLFTVAGIAQTQPTERVSSLESNRQTRLYPARSSPLAGSRDL